MKRLFGLFVLVLFMLYPQLSFATSFSRQWEGSDVELYQTDGYSGSDADLDNTAPVDDTDGYTSVIDLTDYVGANIDFQFTASGSGDALQLRLFRSRSSSGDGTEVAIWPFDPTNDGTETTISVVIDESYGAGYFWFSLQSAAGDDTFDIDIQMRRWKYEDN